jgi:ribosomal protein S18 acetylase RimI-like enzyme
MNIRTISENDITECSKLYIKVFSGDPWNETWKMEKAQARLTNFFKSQGFIGLLAESDKKILGFITGNSEPFRLNDMFYLREMCIKPDLQRSGIGIKLYCELEKILTEKKIWSVYLITQRNIPASQFYQKMGFTISEEMAFFSKTNR